MAATAALVAAAGWGCMYGAASRILPHYFGSEFMGGMENWRNAWSLPTQLGLLPLLYVSRTWQPAAAAFSDTLFAYLFVLYMCLDFVFVSVSGLLAVHHIVCLIGHATVCLFLPQGFATYFAGVVALEVGSATINIWLLDSRSRARMALFALGMTASNAAACGVAYQWALLPIAPVPKAINLVLTLAIVAIRQVSMVDDLRHGPSELREKPKRPPLQDKRQSSPVSVRTKHW